MKFPFFAMVSLLVAVGCKARPGEAPSSEIKEQRNLQSTAPAPTTFHFGEYQYLHRYAENRTESGRQIAPDEWEGIPSTRYAVPYRRGFYVSNHPAYNERYAAPNLRESDPKTPWLVRIELDPACLEGNVLAPDVNRVQASEEFQAFLAGNPKYQGRAFPQTCPETAKRDQEAGRSSSWCHQAFDDFFQAKGYRLVYDHFWPESGFWIVRDRTCISDVLADETSVLKIYAEVPGLWDFSPYVSGKLRDMQGAGKQGHVLLYVLIRALAQAPAWDPELLKQIKANLNQADIVEARKAVNVLVDTALHCQQTGGDAAMRKLLKADVAAIADKKMLDPRVLSFTGLLSNIVARELPRACPGADQVVAKHPDTAYFKQEQTATCSIRSSSCYEWIWENPDQQYTDYIKGFCSRNGGSYATTKCRTNGRTPGRCASTGNEPGIEHNIYYYGVSAATAARDCRNYSTTEYRWVN